MNIKQLFKTALDSNASDLHLVVGLPPMLRIDGELVNIEKSKILTNHDLEQMIFSIITEKQKQQLVTTRELDF